jgi:hypothetical protein
MKKILVAILVVILLAISFFAFNAYIYYKKQGDTSRHLAPYQGTLSGEFVCLPHTDGTVLQPSECAYGIKTQSDEYYVLDLSPTSDNPPAIGRGDHFIANGTITPIEFISTNHWRKYPVAGIFSVSNSVRKLQ